MLPRFWLERVVDVSGTSGTGLVAEGVIFVGGWCALHWLTAHTSVAFYPSLDEVIAIHGHNGATRVVTEAVAQSTAGRALSARLEKLEKVAGFARDVLYHDERGQGLGYGEAMKALEAALASLDEAAALPQPKEKP